MAPYQPNSTAGVAGVTMGAFADTLGQFLLAKINNDQAAKRAQDDDKRALYMLGFTEMLKANPRAFADPMKLGNALKEGGLKTDPAQLGSLAQLFSGIADQRDAEALAAQQAQESFNAMAFGGPMPQPAQQTAAPQPQFAQPPIGPPQVSPAGPPQHAPAIPQPQPAAPLNTFDPSQPEAFDPARFNKFGQPLPAQLPPPPPLDPRVAGQLQQLARLAPGRDLTIKSPDGKSSLKIDRDAGLKEMANQLIGNGMRPFDVYRTFQQQVGGAGLPTDLRQAAAVDGLSMLMDQEAAAIQSGAKTQMDLRGVLQTLEGQGLFIDPKEQAAILEPMAAGVYAGNVSRYRQRQRDLIQAAELTDDPQIREEILSQAIADPYGEALRDTHEQMGGRGFTPEMFNKLYDRPNPEEALMDITLQTSGKSVKERHEATLKMLKEQAQIEAEGAAVRTEAVGTAEKRLSFQEAQPIFEELAQSVIPAFDQGFFDKSVSFIRGDIARYGRQREALASLLARGLLGDKGAIDSITSERALAVLPPPSMLITNPQGALEDLQAFNRIISKASGGRASLKGLPDAMQAPPQDTESTNYLDAIGVKP